MPTLPDLVAEWAADALREGAGEADLVRMLRELEDVKTVAAAVQAEVSVAFDRWVTDRGAHASTSPMDTPPASRRRRGAGVANDVAIARRESPHAGLRHLGLAHALVEELPHALAAMKAGLLTERRAELAARILGCLSQDDRATADAELFADQARMTAWGDRQVEAEARRVAYRLDPVAFTDRAATAREDRRVSLRPAPDTMSWVSALLPVQLGVAVHATLGRLADAARAGGSTLSRSQLMADALVEQVTGLDLGVGRCRQDPTSWGPDADRDRTGTGSPPDLDADSGSEAVEEVPVMVDLVISDETLLRGGPDPAWLQGYGPVPAQTARDWVARAEAQGRAALRRLYAAPETGALVAMDSRARLFPGGLAHLIALRDATCRTPWCDAPIRQTDHIDPAAHGGPTSEHNGQGLCVRCNLDKEADRWRSQVTTDPPRSGVHTVDVTTPAGQRVTSLAPGLPPPARQQPVTRPGPDSEPYVVTVHYCWGGPGITWAA